MIDYVRAECELEVAASRATPRDGPGRESPCASRGPIVTPPRRTPPEAEIDRLLRLRRTARLPAVVGVNSKNPGPNLRSTELRSSEVRLAKVCRDKPVRPARASRRSTGTATSP